MDIKNEILKRVLFFALCFSVFFTSCEWVTIEPIVPELPPPDEEISFSVDIQPIFTSKCNTCHTSTAPILTEGNAYNSLVNGGYVDTGDPENSRLYLQIISGHTGGNSTTNATERALILRWIEEGTQNN